MSTPTQQVVVITGGGTGMGKAMAEAFAAQGDGVALIGRRDEPLRDTAEALGQSASWQRADVSVREQVAAAVAAILARHGRIDVLINAAGFVRGVSATTPLDEAERLWDETVDTNLKGAFLMSVAVAPHLPRPGGRIINISSIAAYTGGSRGSSIEYASAKAGVLGLTVGLARDLSGEGITANAIVPGFIADTGFTGTWSEERVRQIVAQVPAGRGGRADDVAAAALYLASPAASYVTGQVLHVNGGWLFGR
jgi:3-oxoacyl-[acyl-carrier protein] reductase